MKFKCQFRTYFVFPSFVQLGFNESDKIKSRSILIYSNSEHSIYTQNGWLDDCIKLKGTNKADCYKNGRGTKLNKLNGITSKKKCCKF